jgi:hypothetical protein
VGALDPAEKKAISCCLPSSKTAKFSLVKPVMGAPLLSCTTTLICTNRVEERMTVESGLIEAGVGSDCFCPERTNAGTATTNNAARKICGRSNIDRVSAELTIVLAPRWVNLRWVNESEPDPTQKQRPRLAYRLREPRICRAWSRKRRTLWIRRRQLRFGWFLRRQLGLRRLRYRLLGARKVWLGCVRTNHGSSVSGEASINQR